MKTHFVLKTKVWKLQKHDPECYHTVLSSLYHSVMLWTTPKCGKSIECVMSQSFLVSLVSFGQISMAAPWEAQDGSEKVHLQYNSMLTEQQNTACWPTCTFALVPPLVLHKMMYCSDSLSAVWQLYLQCSEIYSDLQHFSIICWLTSVKWMLV